MEQILGEKMINKKEITELAELFKIFSSETRLEILYLLIDTEMCVHDIVKLINMNQSAVSHQLAILREAHLVRYERKGRVLFYSLKKSYVRKVLTQIIETKNSEVEK